MGECFGECFLVRFNGCGRELIVLNYSLSDLPDIAQKLLIGGNATRAILYQRAFVDAIDEVAGVLKFRREEEGSAGRLPLT